MASSIHPSYPTPPLNPSWQLSSWAPIPSFPPLSPADIGLFLPFPLAPPAICKPQEAGVGGVGRRWGGGRNQTPFSDLIGQLHYLGHRGITQGWKNQSLCQEGLGLQAEWWNLTHFWGAGVFHMGPPPKDIKVAHRLMQSVSPSYESPPQSWPPAFSFT